MNSLLVFISDEISKNAKTVSLVERHLQEAETMLMGGSVELVKSLKSKNSGIINKFIKFVQCRKSYMYFDTLSKIDARTHTCVLFLTFEIS